MHTGNSLSRIFLLAGILLCSNSGFAQTSGQSFSWDQATVYHIVIDRFANGDIDNDGSYGRGLDGYGTPYDADSAGHFLGGDFAGITGWIKEGYFNDLGVNVLRLSAPFEQIHGWTGNGTTQEYAYHGRSPLDYTVPDAAYGTPGDFRELVEAARSQGLKVLIDVDLRGPGGPTLHDMVELDFGHISSDLWRSWRPGPGESWDSADDLFVARQDSAARWAKWWNPIWVTAELAGYDPCTGADCTTGRVAFNSRDLMVVDGESVLIPELLKRKWSSARITEETAELESFFDRTGYPRTARYAVVKWVSDWIADYGLAGVIIREADRLSTGVLQAMDKEGQSALTDYNESTEQTTETPFWLVADTNDPAYERTVLFDSGVDAVLNARFFEDAVASGNLAAVDKTYMNIVEGLTSDPGYRVVSQISGPESGLADRNQLIEAGSRLLLAPGPVSIMYGDETGRQPGPGAGAHEARSLMNWLNPSDSIITHWSKLGSFRASHPSVSRGGHEKMQNQPYTFFRGVRIGSEIDRVVIVLGASKRVRLNVARIWADDTVLRDAYTGRISLVSFGQVTFEPGEAGVILIEEVPE